jgi:hypothetical protein
MVLDGIASFAGAMSLTYGYFGEQETKNSRHDVLDLGF